MTMTSRLEFFNSIGEGRVKSLSGSIEGLCRVATVSGHRYL
jgi:hypothetical protein